MSKQRHFLVKSNTKYCCPPPNSSSGAWPTRRRSHCWGKLIWILCQSCSLTSVLFLLFARTHVDTRRRHKGQDKAALSTDSRKQSWDTDSNKVIDRSQKLWDKNILFVGANFALNVITLNFKVDLQPKPTCRHCIVIGFVCVYLAKSVCTGKCNWLQEDFQTDWAATIF